MKIDTTPFLECSQKHNEKEIENHIKIAWFYRAITIEEHHAECLECGLMSETY